MLSQLLFRREASRTLCNPAFEKQGQGKTPALLMSCNYSMKSSYQAAVSGLSKAWENHLCCVRRFDKVKGWSSKACGSNVLQYSLSAVVAGMLW